MPENKADSLQTQIYTKAQRDHASRERAIDRLHTGPVDNDVAEASRAQAWALARRARETPPGA